MIYDILTYIYIIGGIIAFIFSLKQIYYANKQITLLDLFMPTIAGIMWPLLVFFVGAFKILDKLDKIVLFKKRR